MGSIHRKNHGNGFMLLGDAAGLIDPFTGEGIGNAMISAKYAIATLKNAVNSKDFSEEIRNILRFKREEIARKLNFVTKEEFEVQKERLTKIEKKLNSIIKRKKKLKR